MTKIKKLASIFMALTIVLAAVPFASATTNNELVLGGVNPLSDSSEVEYAFNITQAGSYVLQTYSTMRLDDTDTVMYIYDQNHNQIGVNDDTPTTDPSIATKFSTFQRYFDIGTYYVKVVNKDGANLNCDLIFESLGNAESLSINSNVKVTSDTAGNYYKIYKFVVSNGTNFVLETSGEDHYLDTILELYDANHNLIAMNENISDYDGNYFSRISKDLTAGTYYATVRIHRYSNEVLRCHLGLSNNSNYAYITTPKSEGYILQGESRTFTINAPAGATAISLDYVINGTVKNITNTFNWFGSANCYRINANIAETLFEYPASSAFPKFRVTLTNSDGTTTTNEIDGYVTSMIRSRYEGIDQSWYYMDENNNSFVGFASEEYNCMAYALGITDQWMWPWSVGFPDVYPVYRYFDKVGSWADRPGYQYHTVSETAVANPQVLFYDGHVALVTKWDADGNASEVYSKWGRAELIKSNPQDGLRGYGSIILWIKDRVEA